ncbi:MAG TPA: hypothetical protein VNJ08_06270 [Bacteriovoracaceae bacterium]|nr:hypothetical protein [Bacteriovoracaceae bacterium]
MTTLAQQWTVSSEDKPGITKQHMEMLIDLLRDVNLEKRMETLIKAQNFMKEDDFNKETLQSIRTELDEELMNIRKMLFMVDQAQYFGEIKT